MRGTTVEYAVIFLMGVLTVIVVLIIFDPISGITKKLLIKQQCAEYNSTTGDFIIRNLLKD